MANIYIATDGEQICLLLDSPSLEMLQQLSDERQRKVRWCATYEVPEGRFSTLLTSMQKGLGEEYVFPQASIKGFFEEIPSLGWKIFGETLPLRGEERSDVPYDDSFAYPEGIVIEIFRHPTQLYVFTYDRLIELIQASWAIGCKAHRRFLNAQK